MRSIKFLRSSLLLAALSVFLISCDEESVQSLNEQEDAQMVAISLNELRIALLEEVNNDVHEGTYPINLTVAGIVSGGVSLSGANTVTFFGGPTGAVTNNYGTANFELDGYSNSNSIVLDNSGVIRYRKENLIQAANCVAGNCPILNNKDTVDISATGLRVSMTNSGKKIQDVIDIRFLYTRSYKSAKGVVQDSSHYNHFKITTSKGVVFEW